jgi:hypothetical protein
MTAKRLRLNQKRYQSRLSGSANAAQPNTGRHSREPGAGGRARASLALSGACLGRDPVAAEALCFVHELVRGAQELSGVNIVVTEEGCDPK